MTLKILEWLNEETLSSVWRCSDSYFIYYFFGFFLVFFQLLALIITLFNFCFSYCFHFIFFFFIVLVEWSYVTFFSILVKCTRIELNSSSSLSCLKFVCSPSLGLVSLFSCFLFVGSIFCHTFVSLCFLLLFLYFFYFLLLMCFPSFPTLLKVLQVCYSFFC